jgi:hypothetical protein
MSPSPKTPEENKLPDDENASNEELSHPQFHTHHEYIASTDESAENSDDDNTNPQIENSNGYCLLPQESNINQQQDDNDDEDEEFLRFATLRVQSSADENQNSQIKDSRGYSNESVWVTKLDNEPFPVDDEKVNYIKKLMSSVQLPESSIPTWAQCCSEQDWQDKLREKITCRQTTFFQNEKQ